MNICEMKQVVKLDKGLIWVVYFTGTFFVMENKKRGIGW